MKTAYFADDKSYLIARSSKFWQSLYGLNIELARGAKPLIRMEGNSTFLDPPEAGSSQAQASSGRATEKKTMSFSFDKSYWSAGERDDPRYCSQQTLYNDLGKELLDHGFAGFNACIVACALLQSCSCLPSYSELL